MKQLTLPVAAAVAAFLLVLFPSVPVIKAARIPEEAQTLLRIKEDWGNQSALDGWTPSNSSNYCEWHGVTCADDGSVVKIDFEQQLGAPQINPINSSIPASICDLKNLSILILFFNNIPGPFPTLLYNCVNLQHLDLSRNHFVQEIPSDVDRLPKKLTYLYLSGNNFTGDVPASLVRLSALRELYLDGNLFEGFPAELGNLANLEALTLAWNPFAPTIIPPEFGKLTKLTYLWLKHANLEGEIPSTLSQLTRLQNLDLSENSLNGTIPAGIWALENLQYLYLFQNKLSGPIKIDGTIKALGLLQIDLSTNMLNGTIPDEFGKLKNLTYLFLYYNRLSGDIPTSLGLLPSLYDVRLFNNSLVGVLPPELGMHCPLYNFEVSDNNISGELPENLCAKEQLTSIVVRNNQMTGSIPKTLGNCTTLNNIMFENNQFSGEVPAGIWKAINLTTVLMSNNGGLNGTLPDSLPWNLTRLEIQNNQFYGSIPSAGLNLEVFSADNNLFSGELPSSLSGIRLLETLSLGRNLLSGSIPDDITVMKGLTVLDLSHNKISGHIPAGIGSLPVLNSLDLSSNNLSGGIPSEIRGKLSFLNLSSNDLSGAIPGSLQGPAFDQSFLANSNLCATSPSLNVATCRVKSDGSKGHSTKLLIILVVLGASIVLVLASLAFFVSRELRRRREDDDLATWKLTSFHLFDFTESAILRGLKEENLIGSGGSGKVYKISLSNRAGGTVAVKRIYNARRLDSKLEKEFLAEVRILGSIRHSNIVKLLCCMSNADSKLLVYEYMENGSLDKWLRRRPAVGALPQTAAFARTGSAAVRNGTLDWPSRLRVAIGAARGLCYMHHDCSPPVIHRDVKSSNILLDSEFNARIADFGLARMLVKRGQADTVSSIAGSFGYMAPECAYSKVNEKVDVFSFGVVLLELTTGREASDGGEDYNLAQWAWGHLQEGKMLADALDEEIKDPACQIEMENVFKLGLICTGTLPSTRPSMKEVLQILLRCERDKDEKPPVEHDAAPLLRKTSNRRKKASHADGSGNDDQFESEV